MKAQFHLALPCTNVENIRSFYVDVLGAKKGRSADKWIDIDLYGTQLTFTDTGDFNFNYKNYKFSNQVLPSFHFGVIVDMDTWRILYAKILKKNLDATIEYTFLENRVGEHLSFFIIDPDGYTVEFKSFKNAKEIFS
jgi:extradiol dioxygenase family protein